MWFSRRAIGLHALIIVIVPTFAALCIWQVHRALGGNDLSWAYVFEWPFFAGYAVYMWWRFVHEAPLDAMPAQTQPVDDHSSSDSNDVSRTTTVGSNGTDASDATIGTDATISTDSEAAERAAYNAYLAELAARDKPKQWH
jgi:hypothetical protein